MWEDEALTTTAVLLATWTMICTVFAAFIARKPLTTVIKVSLDGEEFVGYDFIIRECRDDYTVLARLDGSNAVQMKLSDEGVEIDRDDRKMTDITDTTKNKYWIPR